jgi:hypothetical protein
MPVLDGQQSDHLLAQSDKVTGESEKRKRPALDDVKRQRQRREKPRQCQRQSAALFAVFEEKILQEDELEPAESFRSFEPQFPARARASGSSRDEEVRREYRNHKLQVKV